jgi:hypothetical protein
VRNGYAYNVAESSGEEREATSVTDNRESKQPNGSRVLKRKKSEKADRFSDRKPISEVLHDIYDKNVQ